MPEYNTDVSILVKEGVDFRSIGIVQPYNDHLKRYLAENDGHLACTYVATADLSDFPMGVPIDARVVVSNTKGDWKGNWLFEGVVFVPTTNLTSAPF
jgi:hypothetical protein